MTLSEADRRRMEAGLAEASAVQIRLFLRYCDLPAGTNDSHEQVIQRVLGYVESEDLAVAAVYQAIVEFQEFRNKAVYLYQTESEIRLDTKRFTRVIDDWGQARIVAKPDLARDNYSYIDSSRVRVCFSEVHRKPLVDYEQGAVDWEHLSRVVVLDADRESGRVSLAFDPPGTFTPRGKYHMESYYGYYRERAEALLGTRLAPISLERALRALEESDMIRIVQGQATSPGGLVRLTADASDMRSMAAFRMVSPALLSRESGRYVWLPNHSANDGSDGNYLLREVHTDIHAPSGMVRFTKDSVSQEVAFVIRELLANA